MELGTMRAGQRRVFDQHDFRILGAKGVILVRHLKVRDISVRLWRLRSVLRCRRYCHQ